MGDDEISGDLAIITETNSEKVPANSSISHDGGSNLRSSISDDTDVNDGDSKNPFLDDIPNPNLQPQDPKTNVSPSIPEDSRIEEIEEAIQELSVLERLRVPGSPRAVVYPRPAVSPRFGSPRSVESLTSSDTPKAPPGGVIDTAAPFESVKEAVSKFGGITDWKAHKIQTIERRKMVDQELEKMQEDIPEYKKKAELAEEAKLRVQRELESTKTLVEELKLEVEKAQKEEQQAKQDSELAKLRVEEMEQGIADEASVAAKAQLEVAKARKSYAVSELESVREEIEAVAKEFEDLVKEKDLAAKKSEDATLEGKEIERKLEGLTIELMGTKKLLESAHTVHLEAEEKKINAEMERDHDVYNWEKELKTVEGEIERLNGEIQASDEIKTKLDAAYSLLQDLRAELAASMEDANGDSPMQKRRSSDFEAAIDSAKNELEEVKANIEKATSEVKTLKLTAASLESELSRERKYVEEIKMREEEINSDATSIQINQKGREELEETSKKVEEAAKEAEEANALAKCTREELIKAKEEYDEAKARVNEVERKLIEAKKEKEASRASEKLALAAIKALQESESGQQIEDVNSPRSVTISVEEYYELSKQAHEAEEESNTKLSKIVAQIEAAKEEEYRVLEKLEEVNKEMEMRKEELKAAMTKAERARDRKLGMEHELRKWRSENGKHREEDVGKLEKSPRSSTEWRNTEGGFGQDSEPEGSRLVPETKKKKKKFSQFAKVFMFLSRKKSNK